MVKEFLQGRFMNHPLHPLLVHLPMGLWVASFVFDIVFMANGNSLIASTSFYCMLFGLMGAALAVGPGLADYFEIPKDTAPKRLVTLHLTFNVIVTVLFVINLFSRYGLEGEAPSIVTRGQFILSLFSILLLGVSGYLGGLLVYDHGVGFKPHLREQKKSDLRRVA